MCFSDLPLFNADGSGYVAPRPVDIVRPEIDATAARLGGVWMLEYQFIVEVTGTVSDVAVTVIKGGQNPLVPRLGAAALRKSKFEPATYKGKAIPTAMVHQMTLNLD